MRRKLSVPMVLFFVLSCFMSAFFSISKAEAATYNLTYSIFFPATHGQAKAGEAWAREVEKRTQGRVKITVFSVGTSEEHHDQDRCAGDVRNTLCRVLDPSFEFQHHLVPLSEAEAAGCRLYGNPNNRPRLLRDAYLIDFEYFWISFSVSLTA